MFENKEINSIRILPNDTETFKTVKEFEHFIKKTIPTRGGKYYFPSLMISNSENALILFQYKKAIRAVGVINEAKKEKCFNETGREYAGYYLFDVDTVKYLEKPITADDIAEIDSSFKGLNQVKQIISIDLLDKVLSLIENNAEKIDFNVKRIETKDQWKEILKNEDSEDSTIIEILKFLYYCHNFTSNGKVIAEYFKTSVGAINSIVSSFGRRIIDAYNIPEQEGGESNSRRWNIPFETVNELNDGIFTWKLRKELIEALQEVYKLEVKEDDIQLKVQEFIEQYPYDEYQEYIYNDLKVREEFCKKFSVNKIESMTIDDFVIGRKNFDEKGSESFCYLIETQMRKLGEMRGATSSKFGVWYSVQNKQYEFTKKYGNSIEEAFSELKRNIFMLLVAGNNKNYQEIEDNPIAPLFKGKILSTYYPNDYLCIFDEDDVNKILNLLDIHYDLHLVKTLEEKKGLLVEYKNNSKDFADKTNDYFIKFLYFAFKNEIRIQNTVSGEIDYNLEYIDMELLDNHITKKKNTYRSRNTDYEKIQRNKKDVGNRGENAVLKFEIARLIKANRINLAEQVRISDNDAIGYDIESFREDGTPLHIEVKTNSTNSSYLDFYLTSNELNKLMDDDNYCIYYLYDINSKKGTKYTIIDKEKLLREDKNYLQPVIYKVNVDFKDKNRDIER